MDTKSKRNVAIGLGLPMSLLFIVQHLLMEENPTTTMIISSIVAGLVMGGLSGLLSSWLLARFLKSKFVADGTKMKPEPGETVLFETPANHLKGIKGAGGKLYVTDRRLLFKPHKLNVENHVFELGLTEIKNVSRYKTLGFVDNGLSIATIDNTTERFVVEQVDQWIKHLEEKLLITKSLAT
jgi:hypothetical protein